MAGQREAGGYRRAWRGVVTGYGIRHRIGRLETFLGQEGRCKSKNESRCF